MDSTLKEAISSHALQCYPFEACGLVVAGVYRPCRNVSEAPLTSFSIDPEDYANAEDIGPIEALVHSHPGGTAYPSQGDLEVCEGLGVSLWVIVSLGAQTDGSIGIEAWHEFGPSGFEAPLIGCEFSHGTNDCFGLVRRYYWQTHKIVLPDFHRSGEWWNDGKSSLYTDNYEACGGVSLPLNTELREGDVLLMKIRSRNNTPNHAAVYVGGDTIIHHLWGQLSRRDTLARYRDYVTHIIRYREALGQS
jgi:proteasome lid subunit RPN8/RPN11